MTNQRFILYLLLCLYAVLPLQGQGSQNPFDLTPRLQATSPVSESEEKSDVIANPFDLSRGSSTYTTPSKTVTDEAISDRRFIFFLTLFNLLLFSFIATLLRNYQAKAFRAFLAPNLLAQLFRERQVGVLAPFLILYSFFFFNAAFFIFQYLGVIPLLAGKKLLSVLLYYFTGVIAVTLVKHFMLWIVGSIFPFQEVIRRYSFLIMIFYSITGFYLAGANLLIAYGPEWLAGIALQLTLFVLLLTLIYRHLRALILTIRLFAQHKFHFLLYICTVELIPFILLIKFLQIYF